MSRLRTIFRASSRANAGLSEVEHKEFYTRPREKFDKQSVAQIVIAVLVEAVATSASNCKA
jgi:hypothetical protein